MRGTTARRLRQIARGLGLDAKTEYAPGGKLRRRPDRIIHGKVIAGAPIPRPFVMVECFRRAYKEAKKIFKGLPATALVPEHEKLVAETDDYRARINRSMRAYYDQAH